ncbi:MAG: UvrD-helicase domain-containing protein [Planctomycetes bacterium]|nr:UvrD-helicase domain-containing protein [Planctomycetota bacterium]
MTEAFDLANAPLTDGTVLLEASAGTGKTWTLCGIVLRLLLEKSVDDLTQVLVVTFTIAATEELKTRLRTGLQRAEAACRTGDDPDPFYRGLRRHGEAGARRCAQALAEFDRLTISTIHGSANDCSRKRRSRVTRRSTWNSSRTKCRCCMRPPRMRCGSMASSTSRCAAPQSRSPR